jgi:diguanylate cyclase (GGDEF)-like protein
MPEPPPFAPIPPPPDAATLALLWAHNPAALALIDEAGVLLAATPAYFRLLDLDPAAALNVPFTLAFPAAERQARLALHQALFRSPAASASFETHVPAPANPERLLELGVTFIRHEGIRRAMLLEVRDVSARQALEEQLRHTQILLTEAQRLANLGSFLLDPSSGRLAWSADSLELLDLANTIGLPTLSHLLAHVHPDDRERFAATLQTAVTTGAPFEMEFRLCPPNGEARYLRSAGRVETDSQNRPRHIFATLLDLTPLKREQQRLEQETQRLQQLDALYTATAALVTTLDLDTLLAHILDAAIRAVAGAENGLLTLIAPTTGRLEVRATLGYADPRIRAAAGADLDASIAQAVSERRPLLVARPTDSQVVAPLLLNASPLGAISLSAAAPDIFDESDLTLLATFAATVSAAIQNATLHAEVQRLAITDALTGLYNRRGFDELGRREVERSRRLDHPLTAVMMDLDHFKEINDGYGHAVGDRMLMAVAQTLMAGVREFDILGRFGGDEFTLLLPETDLFTASNVADRLRQQIAALRLRASDAPDAPELTITLSLGISRVGPDTPHLAALLERADQALYRAKAEGRNRVVVG